LQLTFSAPETFNRAMVEVMQHSREACVNYMMPLGLHHIFKFDHHYGPEPDGFKPSYPREWCPVYYHQADKNGVGFDRSSKGSNAVSQYRADLARTYDNIKTCPENLLLWFHHVPWDYRMSSGNTLWEELQYRYNEGVITVEENYNVWHNKMRPYIDEQRWREVDERMKHQVENAREWRDVCIGYFRQFAEK
jgi:alpha-glucuronidase